MEGHECNCNGKCTVCTCKTEDNKKEENIKEEGKLKVLASGSGSGGFRKALATLITGGLMLMMMLTGCAVKDNIKGISDKSEAQYQYDAVAVDQVVVQQGNKEVPLTELKVPYTLANPSYSGEVLSVYVDGELYETRLSNYVLASSIVWSYSGEYILPYSVEDGVMRNPEAMTAVITYEDGEQKFVTAEYVEVTKAGDVAELYCLVGNTTFYATMPTAFSTNISNRPIITQESGSTEPESEESSGIEDDAEDPSGELVLPTEEAEGESNEGMGNPTER